MASTRTMSREVWEWKRRLGTSPRKRGNGIYWPDVTDQASEKGNGRESPLLLVAAKERCTGEVALALEEVDSRCSGRGGRASAMEGELASGVGTAARAHKSASYDMHQQRRGGERDEEDGPADVWIPETSERGECSGAQVGLWASQAG